MGENLPKLGENEKTWEKRRENGRENWEKMGENLSKLEENERK